MKGKQGRTKTAKDRLAWSLRTIKSTCKDMRHEKIAVQHEVLSRKLRGHYSYFGITGNSEALGLLFEMVKRIWRVAESLRLWKAHGVGTFQSDFESASASGTYCRALSAVDIAANP
ncbi:MAG: hypothetical protein JXX14_03230 [Deltaproteobacteria bacterium]|nr:hypothetical protein [Deltaproteobacteria bacterium]